MPHDLTRRKFVGGATLVGAASIVGLNSVLAGADMAGTSPPPRKASFDDGWKFALGDVDGGLQNQIPSGDSTAPPLNLAGTGFHLSPQQQQPQGQDGTLGEVRWGDNGDSSALWVKTSNGWKKCELV